MTARADEDHEMWPKALVISVPHCAKSFSAHKFSEDVVCSIVRFNYSQLIL